jgi:hypothetical protein
MINVIPSVSLNATPVAEGFANANVLTTSWKAWETGEYGWKRITTTKYEGNAGMVATIDQGTVNNASYSLVSAPYNLSLIKGRLPKLKFKVAYRPGITGSTEILTVSVSSDCGQTWRALKAYSNSSGLGVDKVVELGWKPTIQSEWKELILDLSAYENVKNLMVKFEARSRSGNSIYLDNVNIEADLAASNKLLSPNTSTISVYPNPSKGSVTIEINTKGKSFEGIKILSTTGQVIENIETIVNQNDTELNFTANHLKEGIYFAQIKLDGQLIIKKFIVIF